MSDIQISEPRSAMVVSTLASHVSRTPRDASTLPTWSLAVALCRVADTLPRDWRRMTPHGRRGREL